MGKSFSKLYKNEMKLKIIMLGLDASGKTSILYRLKLDQCVTTMPTVGFNIETIDYKNISLMITDTGGQNKFKPYVKGYYNNGTQGWW